MASASFSQTSFLGGEWSPRAQGRFDDPRYLVSCNVLLNHVPIEDGSAPRRPGFAHLALTRSGAAGRIIDFTYDTGFPYEIEFTDGHIRAFQERALTTTETKNVTTISTATPAVVTLALAPNTAWVTGDQAIMTAGDAFTAETVPLLFNRVFSLTFISTTQFALFDPVTGLPVDGSTLGWTTGLSVTIGQVQDVVSPYTSGTWADVRAVKDETVLTLLQRDTAPQLLTASAAGNDFDTFTLTPAQFLDGPYLDPLAGSLITPDALTGVVNLTLSYAAYDSTKAYAIGDFVTVAGVHYKSLTSPNQGNTPASNPTKWATANSGDIIRAGGFTAADIGRHVRILSEPPDWATGSSYAIGAVVKFNSSYWTALTVMTGATPAAGSINPNQPGNLATTWAVNPTGGQWTWGTITALSTSGLVASSNGTVIGDLSNLAQAFDDITTSSATGAGGASVAGGYVGKHFASPQTITSCRVYGIYDTVDTATVTVKLYGKHTAPSSSSDGTLLCPQQVVSGNNAATLTFIPTDPTIAWEYVWVYLLSQKASANLVIHLSEVQFFTGNNPVGSGVSLQLRGDPLLYTNAASVWRLGLYNAADPVWPTCGCYHEGRLWLGGAVKNRFDASVSNGVDRDKGTFNFAPTNPLGVVGEANAVTYTMNSKDLNQLLWMEPGARGIVGGTNGGEWLISAPTAGAMAPTNIKAVRVTDYGCANVEPRNTGLTTAFVQKFKRRLIEYISDAYSGKFQGPDLTEKALHLTKPGIAEIAYVEGESPTVWCRMEDGSIAGMTYKRVSALAAEPPKFMGWHSHSLGSGRTIESIAAGGDAGGTLTTLYVTTRDPSDGTYHVEVLTELPLQGALITASQFLDNSIVPVSGTAVFVSQSSGHAEAGDPNGIQFNGLWHLNGKKVAVFAAGIDCGDFTVADGSLFVPYGSGDGLFTARWMTQLTSKQEDNPLNVMISQGQWTIPAVIGFPYASRGQLLRPQMPAQAGAQNGPALGKKRRVQQFAAHMVDTQGIYIGTDFDHMRPMLFTTDGGTAVSKAELFSGIFQGVTDDGYSLDGMLAWEIRRPYPATMVALGGFIQTMDK